MIQIIPTISVLNIRKKIIIGAVIVVKTKTQISNITNPRSIPVVMMKFGMVHRLSLPRAKNVESEVSFVLEFSISRQHDAFY